jgi:hypothetical protein
VAVALILLAWSGGVRAQITYTKQDSLKVVKLLSQGAKQMVKAKKELMTYYGNQLKGVPYVPATLEVNKREQLVVNMRQMDCTTFVETVLALAMTTAQGSQRWEDYCKNLTKIRYENGVMKEYPSRNHYFIWWVESNGKQGIVNKVQGDKVQGTKDKGQGTTLFKAQNIHIDWMTKHSDSYPMLKGNKQFIREIAAHEKRMDGKVMMYIPRANLGLSQKKMKWVENGDILAICTKKKGLDTTHIGIADWGSDGKLHLLNASQIHKKVVLESMSLQRYMTKHPSQLGVWVIKPIFR